ncbi:dTDP-4-dehydrorhamnose reductase [Terriglobus sp.]|uniref:dTDP-4-dehydrorhamnose reductase n=1 Tax=Terriglobus sp. TaxID=1889013 RepID=UPI003B00D5CA
MRSLADHLKGALKVLVTGNTGQVGSYLIEALRGAAEVYAPVRAEMDLLSAESIRETVRRIRPDWIFHAAAYTAVDRAEAEREACFAVNVAATRTLAEEARQTDATLVTFSSDYVFDGTVERAYREGDATGPINVYGESKLMAELALRESGCRFLNFRTSWVYSARGNNFVKTMLRLASSRPELKVVADQQGCPSSAREIAFAVASLLHRTRNELAAKTGDYHLAGTGETTWFEFAREIVAQAKRLRAQEAWTEPEPVPSTAYVTAARRPANSRLNCDKAKRELVLSLPDWRLSTEAVVAELLGQG